MEELVAQDEKVPCIFDGLVSTVRTVTLLTEEGPVLIMSAAMRFGVGRAFIDNWSVGRVIVGVDKKAGVLQKYGYDKKGRRFTAHPTTRCEVDGYALPYWRKVVRLSTDVQKAGPFCRLLGHDIARTPVGPVVIEVNANPDIVMQEQAAGPLLRDPDVLRECARYDLLFNHEQRSLCGALETCR